VIYDAPLPLHMEEVHSSPIIEKVPSERHSMIQEEDHPSSYNIKEMFSAFAFHLHRKQVSRKRVQKVSQSDGTLEEMQENEVLFKKNDEDPLTIDTTSTSLTQVTAHNITILNEILLETKLENLKLKDEIISVREEMKKRSVKRVFFPLGETNLLESSSSRPKTDENDKLLIFPI
jgi:hypothetical protein